MRDIREEWANRPVHMMHLSLVEYIDRKDDKVAPAPTPLAQTAIAKPAGRPRHESGQMNGLEKKYAAHLELRKVTGEIIDYMFEPLKLKLAPATFYNPDFAVLMPDGRIQLHECKGGFWEDDARVKIKVAASNFSGWFTLVAAQWDKNRKDWKFEEFK